MRLSKNFIFSAVLMILMFLVDLQSVEAQTTIWSGIESCRDKGNCSLNDILIIGANIAQILFQFAGVALLALFVYGGFLWLTSSGEEEQIKKGKNIIVGAISGLIVMIVAFTLVNFFEKNLLKVDKTYLLESTQTDACVQKHPGWACRDLATACDRSSEWTITNTTGTFEKNLCSGGASNVCCKAK